MPGILCCVCGKACKLWVAGPVWAGFPNLRGQLLAPPDFKKGGCPMVPYGELFACSFVIYGLFIQVYKKK